MTGGAATAFARALVAAPAPLYAVLDGSLAPPAIAEAEGMGLAPRPLWLEAPDAAARDAGPHVCSLPAGIDADVLARWSGGRGVLAVWAWDGDRLSLYRHLRGLNMARIPAEHLAGAPGEPAAPPEPDGCVWALFRHNDPLVLQAVAPTLDGEQAARLVGPARGVLFGDPAAGGALGAARSRVPDAPLRFHPGQLEAITHRRVLDGEARTLALLSEAAPNVFAGQKPEAARAWLRDWRRRGSALGVVSEQDLAVWCLLVVATRGAALSAPELAEACAQAPAPAVVKAVLSGLAAGPEGARAASAALPAAGFAVQALAPAWVASGITAAALHAALNASAALPTQDATAPDPCRRLPPLRPSPPAQPPRVASASAAIAAKGEAPDAPSAKPATSSRRLSALGLSPGLKRRGQDPVLETLRARGAIRSYPGPDGRLVEEFAGSDGIWRQLAEGDVVLRVDLAAFWRSAGADRATAAARGLSDPASYGLEAYGAARKAAAGAAGRQATPFPRAARQGRP